MCGGRHGNRGGKEGKKERKQKGRDRLSEGRQEGHLERGRQAGRIKLAPTAVMEAPPLDAIAIALARIQPISDACRLVRQPNSRSICPRTKHMYQSGMHTL